MHVHARGIRSRTLGCVLQTVASAPPSGSCNHLLEARAWILLTWRDDEIEGHPDLITMTFSGCLQKGSYESPRDIREYQFSAGGLIRFPPLLV